MIISLDLLMEKDEDDLPRQAQDNRAERSKKRRGGVFSRSDEDIRSVVQVRKRRFGAILNKNCHHCTKTGSGQTQEKHSTRVAFNSQGGCNGWAEDLEVSGNVLFWAPFHANIRIFAKTGSGQRKNEEGKLNKSFHIVSSNVIK